MTKLRKFKRVSWHVVRCDIGWKPVVLVGEAPISFAPVTSKREARKLARECAAAMDYSSRHH